MPSKSQAPTIIWRKRNNSQIKSPPRALVRMVSPRCANSRKPSASTAAAVATNSPTQRSSESTGAGAEEERAMHSTLATLWWWKK
jgi:hypothetical protein